MIEIVPSLSVINGKCVRLRQGHYDAQTVYEESPLELAMKFEEHGIKHLHIVDLDGAKKGSVVNWDTLKLIAQHTSLDIDFGGGIRSDGEVAKTFEYGAKQIHISSLSVTDPNLIASWLISYTRNKIILSLDSLNGQVVVKGRDETGVKLMEHIETFYGSGLKFLKCGNIARDGIMEGPDFELYEELLKNFPNLKIYASGGVSSVDDIKRLADMGVHGIMFGRALYEGRITFDQLEKYIAAAV